MRRTHRTALAALGVGWSLFAIPLARAQEIPAPRLDATHGETRPSTFRAQGVDPAAPRRLVLWRFVGNRFERLGATRSERDGRFDFGEQPLPTSSVSFHVAAEGDRPDPDHLVVIERAIPAPLILSGTPDGGEIVLVPAERGGEFRVYDAASDRLVLRVPVEAGARDPLDLRESLPGFWPAGLSIEQVLEDGRRSARRHWRLD